MCLTIFKAAPDWRVWVVYSDVLWVNIVWSLINLLPILPLDGGSMMHAAHGPGSDARSG